MNASLSAAASHPPSVDPNRAIRAGHNKEYPREVWWFVASFIALVALSRSLSWATSKLLSGRRPTAAQKTKDAEAGVTPPARRFSWRNVPLTVVNAYRVVAFRWTLQIGKSYTLNLAEVFITVAYVVGLFTWEFVNTTTTTGQKLDVSYWSGRAGAIATSQLPLVTALGTKNNPIAYITGISYDKLNYAHRMTARVVFVLLWVHGGSKASSGFLVPVAYDEWFTRIGLTALIAFTILIVVSLRPIRARAYELFYFTHFLMILVFLLGAYFHTNNQHVSTYVWPCFLIWGLDRALRLARLVFHNHLYFVLQKKNNNNKNNNNTTTTTAAATTAHPLDASAELLSPHCVRLHLKRPPHFRWTPGQTAFLTMPGVSACPLEAHPFTIASVDARYQLAGAPKTPEKQGAGTDATPYWQELVFLVNVREGFTRRLGESAKRGEKVKVLVDGPYGFSPDLDDDETVVLVAGGSGVSFTLSTFLGVLSHVQNGKSKCRKVVFIWSVREASHIDWISKTLTEALELAPPELEISIRLFVTSGSAPERPWADNDEDDEKHDEGEEDDSVHSHSSSSGTAIGKSRPSSLLAFSAVRVTQGRPDLAALLGDAAEAGAGAGRVSVTVCGSQGIARVCRAALRIPLAATLNGGPSVVLHVESFGYA
ncbi:iron reductase [Trametes gibbosa]|nr:iron reductase [Trametes gibbosa]